MTIGQEVAWEPTEYGELTLLRFEDLAVEVVEVWLEGERLATSRRCVAAVDLVRAVFGLLPDRNWKIALGGLGVGCTASAILADRRVRSLHVLEPSAAVRDWHERGLLPHSAPWREDSRIHLEPVDLLRLGPAAERFDAFLVDVDALPWTFARGVDRCGELDLSSVAPVLRTGGVVAMWSRRPLWRAVHGGPAAMSWEPRAWGRQLSEEWVHLGIARVV
ncbi:MAG: spermidine synthase [Sporichthyaceae bacterium]